VEGLQDRHSTEGARFEIPGREAARVIQQEGRVGRWGRWGRGGIVTHHLT